jgi:hypothetical protein
LRVEPARTARRSFSSNTLGTARFRAACCRSRRSKKNSDDFVFDTQMLAQCIYFGFRTGKYGSDVLWTTLDFRLNKLGLRSSRIFSADGTRLSAFDGRVGDFPRDPGGGRGIRTPGSLPGTVVFKTSAIDHSAIPPR